MHSFEVLAQGRLRRPLACPLVLKRYLRRHEALKENRGIQAGKMHSGREISGLHNEAFWEGIFFFKNLKVLHFSGS